jgi:hypothetical protein
MTAESSEYDGTSWGAQDSLSDPGLAGREYPTNEWWDDFPRSSMVTDTVGRTYVSSINDTDPDDDSVVMFWRAATGYSAMLQGLDGRAHLRHSKILFDGVSRVCQLREVDNAGNHDLVAYCADASVAVGTDPTFVTSTAGGLDATGHDEATDGAGQIVSVFYGEFGGTWGVYSWFANNGTWDVVPTRIDGSGIATGFVSAGDSAEPGGAVFPGGTRPAVAHLGNSRYLAVWIAHDSTSMQPQTQPYWSVYDSGSWSTPVAMDEARNYDTRARHVSPVLFDGFTDNALLAMRLIVSEDATNDYDDTSRWLVGRFHRSVNWYSTAVVGFSCRPGAAGNRAFCSHTPTGAILSNGDSILVYPDQDTDSRFRLRSLLFTE